MGSFALVELLGQFIPNFSLNIFQFRQRDLISSHTGELSIKRIPQRFGRAKKHFVGRSIMCSKVCDETAPDRRRDAFRLE